MHKLYVEPSDEITTVIERLKAAPESLVALVAPKGATLLQSIVNLKLARKAAADAGKELVLVTTDKIGRNLATQLGIPVASNEQEVPKILQEGNPSQEQAEADVIGGVRIHRYYDDGTEPEDSPDLTAPNIVEPIIIPKKMTRAAEPEAAPTLPVSMPEPELVEPPTTPVEMLAAEEIAPPVTPMEVPNMERRSIDPKPLVHPGDTSITRTPIAPRTALAGPRNPRRKIAPFVLYCTGLVLIAAIAVSFLFLPVTNATITVKADTWSNTLTFTGSTGATATSADYTTLPAQTLTADVSDSQTFNATGTKEVGATASGTVDLFNSSSTDPETLPMGSVLTAGGQQFTTTTDVTVPGYKQAPGQPKINGHASVAVTANAPGTAGNVTAADAGTITAPGVQLSGSVTSSGGTSQEVAVISATDISTAETALTTKLTSEVTQKMNQMTTDQKLQFNAASDVLTVDPLTVSVKLGDQSNTGQVQGTAHLQRLAVAIADINAAAQARSLAGTPSTLNKQITATTVTLFTVSKDSKSVAISTTTTGKQSAILDTAAIKKNISGKTLSAAQAYVQNSVPTATLSITQKPGWWPLKRLPYIAHYVTVSITYE